MGSWKGRGNQYIQFVRVLYCKLPTKSKQLPAFPLEDCRELNPGLRGGRRECYHSATVAPSDLGQPHVNPGTNSCSGIGTHHNFSGSVDAENPTVNSQQQADLGIGICGNQLDLAESVDSGNDIFLMEQEIEGSEEETGLANQEQLFAEGIEEMPLMLLCTRENIKTE